MTLLVGGPCNVGPGMVVGEAQRVTIPSPEHGCMPPVKELAETIRSHLDLQKETPNAGVPDAPISEPKPVDSLRRPVTLGFHPELSASGGISDPAAARPSTRRRR